MKDRTSPGDPSLESMVRRLAAGEDIDWDSLDGVSGGAAVEGLRVLDAISRVARRERLTIAEMSGSPADRDATRPFDAPPDSNPVLSTWGPLQILEKIGEGSYGEVFRAHDPALRIDLALKLWIPLWSQVSDLDAFLEEARTLARIRHPNVLTVHGAACHDGRVGMWTELLRGATLEASLADRGSFGAAEACLIGADLCRALAAVHRAGLVHRDVKTRNVMRVEGGRIVLMDFGSVTKASRSAPGGVSPEGTPLTMAPEQLSGGPVGPATDLYALGVLLYRLVSGRYPIEAVSFAELVERHARRERTPLRDRCPDLPYGFVQVVERCLAPDPGSRFQSAGTLEQELLNCVQPGTESSPPAAAGRQGLHLPSMLTRFIGREREVGQCVLLLGQTRLLTLTGVAGCGKTRLALRLAEAVAGREEGESLLDAEGAWFVNLAPLNDSGRVTAALARALGVREVPDESLVDSVVRHIGSRSMLVVLDNCEHVIGASGELAVTLLGGCPNLRLIATSREALGVPGEAIFTVPSLSLPDPTARKPEAVGESEAVQLFVSCAVLARPDFRLTNENAFVVSEICRRLDAIPFAIELAAARLRLLEPEEILAGLEDRFRLLTGGSKWALSRHQTLAATLRWSYELLTEDERRMLRRLSVFAGGWTIEAARRLELEDNDPFATLDHLTRLHEKSLVVVERSEGGSRYRMLETVRQFALEKLNESSESVATRDRHLEHVVQNVEALAPAMKGGAPFVDALRWCDTEHENVLAALAWCDQSSRGPESALRIVGSFFTYWTHRALFSLGYAQVERALSLTAGEPPSALRAQVMFGAANVAFYRGDYPRSADHAETSLAMFRTLGFEPGIVRSLNMLANVRMIQQDFESSRTLYEESLEIARRCGDPRGVAVTLNNLANLASEGGDPAAALPLYRESADINRETGRTTGLALSLTNVADVSLRLGDLAAAKAPLLESLRILSEDGRRDYGGFAIAVAGLLAQRLGHGAVAARLMGASESLNEATGVTPEPSEKKAQAAAVAILRSELGDDGFATAWREGRAMPFEAAMAFAVEWLDRQ